MLGEVCEQEIHSHHMERFELFAAGSSIFLEEVMKDDGLLMDALPFPGRELCLFGVDHSNLGELGFEILEGGKAAISFSPRHHTLGLSGGLERGGPATQAQGRASQPPES